MLSFFKNVILLGSVALVDAQIASVQTANGWVVGHAASQNPKVIEWLGIPYAQPPVGQLRFAPPEPYHGARNHIASNYGRLATRHNMYRYPQVALIDDSDCIYPESSIVDYPGKTPQFDNIFTAFTAINNNTQSEDCLTLNIWSKPDPTRKKPVYIHFYGGRWTSGTTNTSFYHGADLAGSTNIIVITVNYRMNIFGFPGIPNQPSNPGLLDQRLAVAWVKDNILGFGGDPNRITISGQSCGSASVDYWAYAYPHPNETLIAGLISHSGTALSFPVNTATKAAQHWFSASVLAGCGKKDDVLACMRERDASTIKSAAAAVKVVNSNPARQAPAFQPTIDHVTIFENYSMLSTKGGFARVPYLVGHNANEAGFYKVAAYAQGSNLDDQDWWDFNNDTFFCPSNFAAADRTSYGVLAWRFQYNADWNNTRLYPGSGAYHGVDMNMLFGKSAEISGIPNSNAQQVLQAEMRKTWAAFVTDPADGLTTLGWPTYDRHGTTIAEIGLNNKPTVSFSSHRASQRCVSGT